MQAGVDWTRISAKNTDHPHICHKKCVVQKDWIWSLSSDPYLLKASSPYFSCIFGLPPT